MGFHCSDGRIMDLKMEKFMLGTDSIKIRRAGRVFNCLLTLMKGSFVGHDAMPSVFDLLCGEVILKMQHLAEFPKCVDPRR